MFSLILSLFCVATVDAGSNCCDGTYSSSEGSGTCSWHGGVCNTTYTPSVEPVYTAPTALNAKWEGPIRSVIPARPGETTEGAYWSGRFYQENGKRYVAGYKCFNSTDDQIVLTLESSTNRVDNEFTVNWVFTFANDSVKEYSTETWIEANGKYMDFASSSERIVSDFSRAADVSVVWKEGGKNYYATWNLKGSKAAVAATKAKCGIK